ncbi:histidine kinase [Aquimarina sp. TRL1]|uniref:tetratricopeptide repeat-containing sensor histidine kinase n=1 Tax=Aquimarina sp. (strain TRL1) TaxID=2736252 RepID=UPI00158E2F5B|nr:histidine kinase [Aquimarina sp. TRL1]QKX03999.1 histidine kinase [Aquimarina sp. TRL1]
MKSSIQLSCILMLFFCFMSCDKKATIRPAITTTLSALDTISQKKPLQALKKIDSLSKYVEAINEAEIAILLFKKGEIYFLNDQYYQALKVHKQTYQLFHKLKDDYNKGRSLITLCAASLHLGKVEEAQEYALEALRISQDITNDRLCAKSYNQLFHLHLKLKDYNKALTYIKKADSVFTHLPDTISKIAIKSNMSSVYVLQKKYNRALENYQEIIQNKQYTKDPKMTVSILNNIGYTYLKAKEEKNAEKFFRGAITLNKNIKAINAAPYKGLGHMYLMLGVHDSATTYYEKALGEYKKHTNHSESIEVYDKLISIAILEEKYQRALEQQIIRDSIQQQQTIAEKNKLLSFANVTYEIKQREAELAYEKELHESNKLLFATIVLSLLLVLIVVGFWLYTTKLRSANTASKLEQRLLRAQMNPHFIFNTLAAIQNIILKGDSLQSSNYIARFSKLIRQNFDYVRKEKISLHQEIGMITNYIETQQLRFNNMFTYTIMVEKAINTREIFIPPMLLQPFVENAIEYGLKHKEEKGKLLIDISETKEGVQFVIEDNGVGRNAFSKQKEIEDEVHATDVFKERLKHRKKGEEKHFYIQDLVNDIKESIGTRVVFKLRML